MTATPPQTSLDKLLRLRRQEEVVAIDELAAAQAALALAEQAWADAKAATAQEQTALNNAREQIIAHRTSRRSVAAWRSHEAADDVDHANLKRAMERESTARRHTQTMAGAVSRATTELQKTRALIKVIDKKIRELNHIESRKRERKADEEHGELRSGRNHQAGNPR